MVTRDLEPTTNINPRFESKSKIGGGGASEAQLVCQSAHPDQREIVLATFEEYVY